MLGRTLGAAVLVAGLACARSPVPPTTPALAPNASAATRWVAEHAIAPVALDPDGDLADLRGFEAMVGDARIVGLGEANHGAHELFTLRHRLVRLLVERMGFEVFALEADHAPCNEMNDYVLNGSGDPGAILANAIGAIPWDSEEFLAVVLWIRRWNADPAHLRKVRFLGFDAQSPVVALGHVATYLHDVDPEWSAALLPRLAPIASYRAVAGFAGLDAAAQQATQAALAELLARFDAARAAWIARSSEDRWRRARQEAHTADQAQRLLRGAADRDQNMADNLMWIANQQPGARIVVWAHNGHLGFDTGDGPPPMGAAVKARFGAAFVDVVTAFDHGAFRARRIAAAPDEGWRVFSLAPAPVGSLEAELAAANRGALIVDLRAAPGEVARWFDTPRPFRTGTGAAFDDRALGAGFQTVAARKMADAVAFVAAITPARPNPWSWQNEPRPADARAPRNLDWRAGPAGAPPTGWTVTPGSAAAVDGVSGARTLTIPVARGPGMHLITVQQSIAADPGVGAVALRAEVSPTTATAWLWLSGELPGGALAIRKLAALRPGPDGHVRIDAAVPPGTSALHLGISSAGDAAVRVGAIHLELVPR